MFIAELQKGLILNPEPGWNSTFIFEAQFGPESQVCRLSQDMHNCNSTASTVASDKSVRRCENIL